MKHKHAELIKMWADGARIEMWDTKSKEWIPDANPSWASSFKYRIKSVKSSINWDYVRSDIKYLGLTSLGEAFFAVRKPRITSPCSWDFEEEDLEENDLLGAPELFSSFIPGSGDWKESLVERPVKAKRVKTKTKS